MLKPVCSKFVRFQHDKVLMLNCWDCWKGLEEILHEQLDSQPAEKV